MKHFKIVQKIKVTFKSILYVFSALIIATSTSLSVYASPTISSYAITSTYRNPTQMVSAGGSLWYLEALPTYPYPNNTIAKVTTSGTITDYSLGHPSGETTFSALSITTGPDGNIWFSGKGASAAVFVGSLNISTGAVTFYIGASTTSYNGPINLTLGPDGKLWYTVKSAEAQNYTYLISFDTTTHTSSVAETMDNYANITSMTVGSDGNLWYTDTYYNWVIPYNVPGYGTAATATTRSIPNTTSNSNNVEGITTGPDGNLWFSYQGTSSSVVNKLTPSGVFTQYTLASNVYSYHLTAGSDGALWFRENSGSVGRIGRITTSGVVTDYTIPGSGISGATPATGVTAGPNNTVWFTYTDSGGGKLGSITTTPTFSSQSMSSSYIRPAQMVSTGGSVWYLEAAPTYPFPNDYLAKMTTAGVITDYSIGHPSGATTFDVKSMTTGADGNIWFTGKTTSAAVIIGCFNITTGVVTFYTGTLTSGGSLSSYNGAINLTLGPDGKLWYTVKSAEAQNYTYLVSFDPTNHMNTIAATMDNYANITSMTVGSDGNLWYTDTYYNWVIPYAVPGYGTSASTHSIPNTTWNSNNVEGITSGPDGNLWFSYQGSSSSVINKMTTGGVFTQYTLPSGIYSYHLVTGSDGALWFRENSGSASKIGRITTIGTTTDYTIPGSGITGATSTSGITLGSDGAIWFTYTDSDGGKVGRLGY